MAIDLTQFHDAFFDESFEALDSMEAALLQLDTGSPDPELSRIIPTASIVSIPELQPLQPLQPLSLQSHQPPPSGDPLPVRVLAATAITIRTTTTKYQLRI